MGRGDLAVDRSEAVGLLADENDVENGRIVIGFLRSRRRDQQQRGQQGTRSHTYESPPLLRLQREQTPACRCIGLPVWDHRFRTLHRATQVDRLDHGRAGYELKGLGHAIRVGDV